MNRGDLRKAWRVRVDDVQKPYLWSDAEFDQFLDDAINEVARRAHLLVDSTSPLTQASVAAGDIVVKLDPRIIFIRRARLVVQKRRLNPMGVRDIDEQIPDWESAAASVPQVFVPDYQTGAVALWPPSRIDDTLAMTVVREPLAGLADDEESPEIPPRYHLGLLNWCSFRAYSKQDTEVFDPKAADKASTLFDAEFGPRSSAIDEQFSRENYYGIGDYQ
jgi:hypothetical protein